MMADSGARGSMHQIRQLAGMRGLMANTSGKTIEMPIRANFREGLNVLEYFISSRGARKGLADTALRTADSGYLTRRLVDVSQEVIIREEDCGAPRVSGSARSGRQRQVIESCPSADRPLSLQTISWTPDRRGPGHQGQDDARATPRGRGRRHHQLEIRSVLTCRHAAASAPAATASTWPSAAGGSGEAVGIIAAQSIGEPGTQLTMRTFHTGGVAGGDITQGLPRVEELFEARKPEDGHLAEIGGRVSIEETKRNRHGRHHRRPTTATRRPAPVPTAPRLTVRRATCREGLPADRRRA